MKEENLLFGSDSSQITDRCSQCGAVSTKRAHTLVGDRWFSKEFCDACFYKDRVSMVERKNSKPKNDWELLKSVASHILSSN